MIAGLKPIETIYRGDRFRSRLEARWAVFFTELGIKYEYEKEGFDLGEAGRYLPDFWLPELETWAEVKPELPKWGDIEWKKLNALRAASGKDATFLCGLPDERPSDWHYCIVCKMVSRKYHVKCACLSDGERYDSHYLGPLVNAGIAARQARFEYGEHGAADRSSFPKLKKGGIYLAGKMSRAYCYCDSFEHCSCVQASGEDAIGEPGCTECYGEGRRRTPCLEKDCRTYDWRSLVLDEAGKHAPPKSIGGWTYYGPDCTTDHNDNAHGIVGDCLNQILKADAVFCWLHREDIHGTMAEIAWAKAYGKAVFVAFDASAKSLAHELWFAKDLADEWVATVDPQRAWALFEQWLTWKQWRSRA